MHNVVRALAFATLAATPLAVAEAQVPQGSSDELVRGLAVRSAQVTERPIELSRGDTVIMTIPLLDEAGQRVLGAKIGVSYGPGPVGVQRWTDSVPDAYRIWGSRPGTTEFFVSVQIPGQNGGFAWRPLGIQLVTVADWPLARIDIHEPEYTPYAGTTFALAATAITDHQTEHETATVAWRSEDPSIATITEHGIVSFARAGDVTVVAEAQGVIARKTFTVRDSPVRQLDIRPRTAAARTGDVIRFTISALDGRGRPVEGLALGYAVQGMDGGGAAIYPDGAFVAENPGGYKIFVTAGAMATTAVVQVSAREPASEVELVGRGVGLEVSTSDLWVFEGRDGRDYAYTGTHADGGGNRMYAWDVTDPENPVLTDSVVVDGRVVNDVKVNGDASWAIITRERASSRRNGIVVLDLRDPAHPTILSELTDQLTAGIHNVWINGDVVYAVNNGTNAMNILDLSDPATPRHAGHWEIRPGDDDKSLHDVWADGQYAYLSYWDDGLVILDVGAGTHGGTPTEPAFVSQYRYPIGNTHTAYREGDYLFVGDEFTFGPDAGPLGPRGYIHVIDVSDLEQPKEVATYEVPEAGAHNIWVENGVLYIAYYQGGLRIVDVSGELRGDLYRQGRQIGWFHPAGNPDDAFKANSPMAWGPQVFKGNIFVSDMNSGLWIVKHQRPERLSP